MSAPRPAVAELVRAAARWRWLLAGGLAAAAVATGLPVLRPPGPPVAPVLVAARDLHGGAALLDGDVVARELPRDAVPDGALGPGDRLAGRLLAGPVRRGETFTDARVVGPGLLAAVPGGATGLVAVPVRLADRASVALLRPGDRVDVLAAGTSPDGPADAAVVAAAAPVLAVPTADGDLEGALVVLATTAGSAARLATAAVSSRLSVVVRP